MPFVFGYKFRGIQHYIGRGSRLTDIAGGSELIDSLTRGRLAEAFSALSIGGAAADGAAVMHEDRGRILQAASGCILLLFSHGDVAQRFARLWPMIVEQCASDARHSFDLHETTEAGIAGAVTTVDARIRDEPEMALMAFPPANPLTMRERRTGLPVTELFRREDGSLEDRDASSQRRFAILKRREGKLKRRFGFGEMEPSNDADAIARASHSDVLAVVHADGTKFGTRFRKLMADPRRGVDAVTEFSKLAHTLFCQAATFAVEPVLEVETEQGEIACRPILLSGDDMTVLVPGRFGIEVARRFLQHLETASAEALPDFTRKYGLVGNDKWQRLHAGAGVAFVHAHYPFDLALRLASTCAAWAKKRAEEFAWQASSLQFHAALDSATDDFDDIVADQLQRRDASGVKHELTAGPYLTRRIVGASFATLDDLDALRNAVAGLPRRGWREIARLVHERDDVPGGRRFERQLQILDSRQRDTLCNALGAFGNRDGIWSPGPSGALRTPVQDVDVLIGLERRFAREQETEGADA